MSKIEAKTDGGGSAAVAGSAANEHDAWTCFQEDALEAAAAELDAEARAYAFEYAEVRDEALRDQIINARIRLERLARMIGNGMPGVLIADTARLLKERADLLLETCEAPGL